MIAPSVFQRSMPSIKKKKKKRKLRRREKVSMKSIYGKSK